MERVKDPGAEFSRIVILDNGLNRIGDHSFAIARALSRRLAEANMPISIYSLRDVDPAIHKELVFSPHFEFCLYDSQPPSRSEHYRRQLAALVTGRPADQSLSERRTARNLNKSFEQDLERLPSDIWAKGTLVLFPGLIQNQILGLARFLHEKGSGISAKIVCHLMFEPSWLMGGKPSRLGPRLYRRAFKRFGPMVSRTIFFTTENRLISDLYARRFGVPTRVLPVPLPGTSVDVPASSKIRLGFFGYSKVEKGFDLLPDAIELCRAARTDLAFTVQIQHHDHEPATRQAEQRLRQMGGVRLIDGALPEAEFAAESAAVDIVLLPYHPGLFGVRGSGVFTEAITAGRLIVASGGTWAGQNIEAGEAIGETFTSHTSQALAEAILRLCDAVPTLRPQALKRARAFAQEHSIDNYLKCLLAVVGLRAPATLTFD